MANRKNPKDNCPCGGTSYATCCQPLHLGIPAPNAEKLMRSRYSAYVLKLENYLLATWHASTRPEKLDLSQDKTQWIALEVKQFIPESDQTARVEFIARYKCNGRAQRLHEISHFVRENERWFYVDGEFKE